MKLYCGKSYLEILCPPKEQWMSFTILLTILLPATSFWNSGKGVLHPESQSLERKSKGNCIAHASPQGSMGDPVCCSNFVNQIVFVDKPDMNVFGKYNRSMIVNIKQPATIITHCREPVIFLGFQTPRGRSRPD
jgi:hypothetical protein